MLINLQLMGISRPSLCLVLEMTECWWEMTVSFHYEGAMRVRNPLDGNY